MKKKIIPILLLGILVGSVVNVGALYVEKSNLKQTVIVNEYDMVIIAPEKFSSSLQPLIEHKNSHGVKTILKKTEEIYSNYEGRDKAEQIKYFIKDALEQWNIRYVLLVGGRMGQLFRWYIPVRYSNVDDGFMHKRFLSDLYFADIYKENGEFEDWDSNGNGIFAEWSSDSNSPDDVMDLKPDVAVGRLPCRYKGEVIAIVEKIIGYENNAFGQDWFNNILLIGGDTNPGVGEPFPYEGEVDCDWVLQYLNGFNATKLYTSDGTLTGKDDFIPAFNNGNGLVYYAGHGSQYRMGTHAPDNNEWIFFIHNNYVSELKNEDMYPVMVVGCCLTTEFEVGILNFITIFKNLKKHHNFFNFRHECIYECIGWNLVKKSDRGSIAHIGSSSTTWGSTGDKNNDSIPDGVQNGYTVGLCTEFFRVFGEDEKIILGEIFSDTLTNFIEEFSAGQDRVQCKCVQEFMLIGDPSLKIGGYR
jgi:hypothetical protein